MHNTASYNVVHYVIAMLKQYGIKNIVASPGTQNAYFNYFVQEDPYFNCYSVIDERSAAYVATGIAYENGEPVIITCTEATASRNYLSAMTEAYYKKLPIIALTFFNSSGNEYNIGAQYINRNNSPSDTKYISLTLPEIYNRNSKKTVLDYLNAALATVKYQKKPVHINCPSILKFDNIEKTLPSDIWSTNLFYDCDVNLKEYLHNKTVAVFVGSHNKFTRDETQALSNFAISWNIPVICDHTANYLGENKILTSQIASILKIDKKPDLIIDIGNVCGEYSSSFLFQNAEVWRISQTQEFKFRFSVPVSKTYFCSEENFFIKMTNNVAIKEGYYSYLKKQTDTIRISELPFCNAMICKELSRLLPKNCSLNLSILNSLRCMNFFDLDNTINVNCNVGGFGIDGAVSTLVGQSLVNPDKKCFGLIGDLAFFYDMNAIGNRHIKNNLRIIVINNNKGEEFRLNPILEKPFKDKNDVLIAAGGHNKGGAEGWAKSCGFIYLSAKNKEEFLDKIKDFCTKEYAQPLLFEVFTTDEDEKAGLNLIKNSGNKAIKDTSKESTKDNLLTKITNIFHKESK